VSDYLQERLDAAFPSSADAQLVRAVQQGILLSDAVIENERWLRGLLGRDVRGYLRRAGVLSRVHAACEAGDLPFEATIAAMPRGPFHWVEITSAEYKAHICRTESAGAFPEDTPTRQDERLTNQRSLFDNVVPLKEAAEAAGTLFAWLTFGIPDGGKLGHLCWAMPSSDGKAWLAQSNVLYRLAAAHIEIEPEPPAERAKIIFRDQIAEALKASEEDAAEDGEK
jgi:hypothetical protein